MQLSPCQLRHLALGCPQSQSHRPPHPTGSFVPEIVLTMSLIDISAVVSTSMLKATYSMVKQDDNKTNSNRVRL